MARSTRQGQKRPVIVASYVLIDGIEQAKAWLEAVKATDSLIVYLARTVRCVHHTVRGVPGRRISFVVQQDNDTADPRDPWVTRISRVAGRYDGSLRNEIILRRMPEHQVRTWDAGYLRITGHPEEATVAVRVTMDPDITEIDRSPMDLWYDGPYEQLKSDLLGYDLKSIAMWHWARYYKIPLAYEEAQAVADEFAAIYKPEAGTLAEANRVASRLLYAAARNAGWRKLTLREQAKAGVSGQWHRADSLPSVQREVAHATA